MGQKLPVNNYRLKFKNQNTSGYMVNGEFNGLRVERHFFDFEVLVNPQADYGAFESPQTNRLQGSPKLVNLVYFVNRVSSTIMVCNHS